MNPCSDHSGDGPSALDLPLPAALKHQWLDLATRRQVLGRSGKALAWAGLTKQTYGRDQRLTGVEPAKVVKEIMV
jgi:hypothetical protein